MFYYTRICKRCNNVIEITQDDMLDMSRMPPYVVCNTCHKPKFLSFTVHFSAMLTALIAAMHVMQLAKKLMHYFFGESDNMVMFIVMFLIEWSAVFATFFLTAYGIKYLCYHIYCQKRKNV